MIRTLAAALFSTFLAFSALAQNPVQWKGNARAAIEDAKAQNLPLMFWVTEGKDYDDDDLRDAQERAFRDPVVVWLSRSRFIPVRVARNSNVLKVAEEFGLPTTHGLYVAVMSPDGKVLAEINPIELTDPSVLATRLQSAFDAYRADIYETRVKPVLANPESPLPALREALTLVWKMNITAADAPVVALLARPNLTKVQTSRLYSLLASLATEPAIKHLLGVATTDPDALKALRTAPPGALRVLLAELPEPQADPSAKDAGPGLNDRQFAAYAALCTIAKAGEPRPKKFWETAPAKQQADVLTKARAKAEAVLAYWDEGEGKYR